MRKVETGSKGVSTINNNSIKINNNRNNNNSNNNKSWGPQRTVDIIRSGSQSLGFDVTVASNNKFQVLEGVNIDNNTGIFISSFVEGSPAAAMGCLNIGDRILAVGNVDLRRASHGVAAEAIRRAGDQVKLTVQSLISKPILNKQ